MNKTAKPEWIHSDRNIDITDLWQEKCGDPENVCGMTITAHMRAWGNHPRFDLVGVSIADHDPARFYDREWAIVWLGIQTIRRAEDLEWEAAGTVDERTKS